jgi:hypothetical protein
MFKVIEFDAFHGDDQVLFTVDPSRRLVKQAAWCVRVSPEIEAACRQIEKRADRRYFLNVALGAGETWGHNKNGDWFGRDALAHQGQDYGHETFLKAGRFRHHCNKDPEKSLGKIVYAHWNPRMDRVELLSWIDVNKAPDIAERLDRFGNGDDVKLATSMGCKVPYDRCSVCMHKAATVKQYCGHLKTAMGRILPGGRAIYAINDHPRFFDDSFVLMPAAREAGVTMKVAEAGPIVILSAERGLEVYGEDKAGDEKASAINKKIPGDTASVLTPEEQQEAGKGRQLMEDLTPVLLSNEPDVKTADIHRLASLPIESVLATATAMGFFIKASEFQKLALASRGSVGALLAEHLELEGVEIDPEHPAILDKVASVNVEPLDIANADARVVEILAPYREKRSYWEPWFSRRLDSLANVSMKKIARAHAWTFRKRALLESMIPIALAYALYRAQLGKMPLGYIDELISRRPELAVPLLGMSAGMVDVISKGSPQIVNEKTGGIMTRFVIPGFAPYIYAAGVQRKEQQGYPTGDFERLVKEHPGLFSLLGVGAAGIVARKSQAIGKALQGLAKAGAEIPNNEEALVALLRDADKAPAANDNDGLVSGAAKNVMAGIYRARHFPGAMVDEYIIRKLLG